MQLKFAFKSLLGQGVRTWLNAGVLALALLAMVFVQGLNDGAYEQMERSRISEETAHGQLWHPRYDPLDPVELNDAHGPLPPALAEDARYAPVLLTTATIYPRGRMQAVTLRGIAPDQRVLALPFERLTGAGADGLQPVMIGARMARRLGVAEGDQFVMRWRTAQGMFDAREALVVAVFDTEVPVSDQGQIWLPLADLQQMRATPEHATLLLLAREAPRPAELGQWEYQSLDMLLADTRELRQMDEVQAVVLFVLLLSLALVSVFDTQVLAVFKRRREIGVMMALGLTQRQVIAVFIVEGVLLGLFAFVLAAIVGGPLLAYTAINGINLGGSVEGLGMAMAPVIYPYFSAELVVRTAAVMLVLLALVSYLPARRIARLLPTQAIRGDW